MSFLLVIIRIPNTNTFLVQATAACLSTCIKLCARLCICIEPVALLPTGVVCQNFPREFHRRMRHELSFHFIPLYQSVAVFSFVAVVLLANFFFFFIPILTLKRLSQKYSFQPFEWRERAWYRRVHRPFLYSTLLFSLMWRERAKQTLVEFKHPSNAISIGRQLWWSFRNVAVMPRVPIVRDFVRLKFSRVPLGIKENSLHFWRLQAAPKNSVITV